MSMLGRARVPATAPSSSAGSGRRGEVTGGAPRLPSSAGRSAAFVGPVRACSASWSSRSSAFEGAVDRPRRRSARGGQDPTPAAFSSAWPRRPRPAGRRPRSPPGGACQRASRRTPADVHSRGPTRTSTARSPRRSRRGGRVDDLGCAATWDSDSSTRGSSTPVRSRTPMLLTSCCAPRRPGSHPRRCGAPRRRRQGEVEQPERAGVDDALGLGRQDLEHGDDLPGVGGGRVVPSLFGGARGRRHGDAEDLDAGVEQLGAVGRAAPPPL